MTTEGTDNETARTLRRAHARLTEWTVRLDLARELRAELDPERRHGVDGLLREFSDRREHAENQLLRLQTIERAWGHATGQLERSFSELDPVWRALVRALEPRGMTAGP